MKNVMERLVIRGFDELLPSVPELCRCQMCREDVLVYALNRLPPHYTSTLKGEVVSNLELGAGQGSVNTMVVLMEGMRMVAASPRCGRVPPAGT